MKELLIWIHQHLLFLQTIQLFRPKAQKLIRLLNLRLIMVVGNKAFAQSQIIELGLMISQLLKIQKEKSL